jgi:hypothetical protein
VSALYKFVIGGMSHGEYATASSGCVGGLVSLTMPLSRYGWTINTAFVKRLNLDIRQRVAAIGRRVNTLCQGEDGMLQQLAVFHAYHNWSCPCRVRTIFQGLL